MTYNNPTIQPSQLEEPHIYAKWGSTTETSIFHKFIEFYIVEDSFTRIRVVYEEISKKDGASSYVQYPAKDLKTAIEVYNQVDTKRGWDNHSLSVFQYPI